MIKHCEWIDEQPAFYKDVEVDGQIIATIHALTKLDMSEIRRKADTKTEMSNDGKLYFITNPEKLELARIYASLTGQDKSGWGFDREITEDNIAKLPRNFYDAINKAIADLEKQNVITDGISKN